MIKFPSRSASEAADGSVKWPVDDEAGRIRGDGVQGLR